MEKPMLARRRFLKNISLFAMGMLMGYRRDATAAREWVTDWFMPDEAGRHTRTWMAFGASERIWGKKLLPEVRHNLATIAQTIAHYEPVSMLVRSDEFDIARSLVGTSVELIELPLDDLWIRDTGPTFVVTGQGCKAAIDFNFNGWGEKQAFMYDAEVAAFVAELVAVPIIKTPLVLEGGCIEVDGQGTALMTESCVLNDNRNPGIAKAQFEDEFMPLLGLKKIIWLPGIRGRDITDGHTDFYARFARPGVVVAGFDPDPGSYDHVVTQRHLEILRASTDAQGRRLDVIVLEAPRTIRRAFETDHFAAGYVGYYVCQGAVIMQSFGDVRADRAAQQALQAVFPDHEIEQIAIDGIAAGGGSIHCATQQEPWVPGAWHSCGGAIH